MSEKIRYYDRVLMLGMPASGKSTLMSKLVRLCNENEISNRVVDDFVTLKRVCPEEETDREYYYEEGNLVIRSEYQTEVMERMYLALRDEIKGGSDELVFWEMTHPKLMEVLPKYFSDLINKKTLVVWVDSDYELAWQRNKNRVGHVIPESYISLFRVGRDENVVWLRANFPNTLIVSNDGGVDKLLAESEGIMTRLID